jgi:exopolyphosphatase/guanosine-5'-triphosphate,3'-diphosphate pyrophosphatase
MRVATIDIGTNTVLLLVAEPDATGELRAVEERAAITRLGEGVDRTRSLSPGAVSRTLACLAEYAAVVRAVGVDRVGIVGTSAMRDAAGGEAFRAEVNDLFGVSPVVLSGEDEARLSFQGALSAAVAPGAGTEGTRGVFDIGGGSTEVILGSQGGGGTTVSYARSFDIGSVRLTERLISGDPPSAAELALVRSTARECLQHVPPLPDSQPPVGVAGTMTTLAAVHLALAPYDGARVHGLRLSVAALTATVAELAALRVQERASIRGMEPKRADVIVAGGLIALELLEHWRAEDVIVSDRGVRWGLAEELSRRG